ncbi:Uncharacterized protein BP5553_01253 [Venustampulla echinocandica]|uniref:MNN4-regulates the mannosylphosphorylation n=1 Tax=Venustampulla echinocandica TaxID=2656787 RepID=A0A370U0I4_9HELO|nr:Uncharacterized protein BP5553_01253 [Venustampulla echinocandica]RDL41274.1 Uncharacterized protein BP5553_01253 [Venustampulla echinocandica]
MLRTTAARSLLKSLPKTPNLSSNSRSSYSAASAQLQNANALRKWKLSSNHPQRRSLSTTTLRYATPLKPNVDKIDRQEERRILEQKIKPDPANVSTESSVRQVFEESQRPPENDEPLAALKSDIETVKDTFALNEVPRESLYLGLAGVIPYAATSFSTVYLAWDINHAHAAGTGLLFEPERAHQLLEFITPIQVGYGAVIISFLGAIHWGLEYAGYGGHHSYRRFMYGVIAPAVAWPTIFMSVEYALITQFVAFNMMYFADTRATRRGWCPPWYSTYRFVLTFLVGASIVATLIGRGQIASHDSALKAPMEYLKPDRDAQREALAREEEARNKARRHASIERYNKEEQENKNKDIGKEDGDKKKANNEGKTDSDEKEKGGDEKKQDGNSK